MKMRRWPFPGDSAIARARKVALAYRQMSKDQLHELALFTKIIGDIDERIAGWIKDPEFQRVYKNIKAGDTSGETVDEMDKRFFEWGEEWHADVVRPEVYDDDEMINSHEAGGILGINFNHMSRLRIAGRINGEHQRPVGGGVGRWYYRAGDVYALSTKLRERGGRSWRAKQSADSIQDNSTGDAG